MITDVRSIAPFVLLNMGILIIICTIPGITVPTALSLIVLMSASYVTAYNMAQHKPFVNRPDEYVVALNNRDHEKLYVPQKQTSCGCASPDPVSDPEFNNLFDPRTFIVQVEKRPHHPETERRALARESVAYKFGHPSWHDPIKNQRLAGVDNPRRWEKNVTNMLQPLSGPQEREPYYPRERDMTDEMFARHQFML